METKNEEMKVFDIRLLNYNKNWILLDLKKEDIKSIKEKDHTLIIETKISLSNLDTGNCSSYLVSSQFD